MYYNEGVKQASIVRISIPSVLSIVQFIVLVKYICMYFRTFVAMHKKGGTELGTLYERIQTLCKNKGVSGSRMCLDLGLSKSMMSDLKYGRTKGMSATTAAKIAAYFDVTVCYLLGEEEQKEKPTANNDDGLTENQRNLIEFVKHVPDESAAMILKVIRSIVEVD